MEPVVNGLEEKYNEQIDFRSLDANSLSGQKAFRAFGMPGHPSFVLLDSKGESLWIGFGEQNGENLELAFEQALSSKDN